MRTRGWVPLEDYPGAGKPWRCRCVNCGVIKPKKLSHVQTGRYRGHTETALIGDIDLVTVYNHIVRLTGHDPGIFGVRGVG